MIEADFNGGDVNRGEKIVNNGKPFFSYSSWALRVFVSTRLTHLFTQALFSIPMYLLAFTL